MKKLAFLFVCLMSVGCGGETEMIDDSSPTGSSFNFLTLNEFNDYLTTMEAASVDVLLLVAEFSSITRDLNSGVVSTYWITEFTRNLMRRLDEMQTKAMGLRPDHPTLLQAHVDEYEGALADYETAFTVFLSAVNNPGVVPTNALNDPIIQGNQHLIRFEEFLSSLRGRSVNLFGDGVSTGGGL